MTDARLENSPGSDGPLEADPVFIAGAPRSGVRLLAAALDRHPMLASGPELPFIVTMAQQWRIIDSTLGANHARHHRLTPEATRQAFRTAIMQLLAQRLSTTRKTRMVLQSFAGMLCIGEFAAMFPRAHFIVMVRDPRDVTLSLRSCDWRNPRDGLPLPYTQDAATAARFWSGFIEAALPALNPLVKAGRALVLRYEDLCGQPTRAMERLAELCGLPAHDPVIASDSAQLVTMSQDNPHPPLRAGNLDVQSVGRWRDRLNASESAIVESATRTTRVRLGYQ